ncbi:hypothetical protein CC86DRAFT_385398 [Ophiobolus disseminans]|uniref:Uncharacterized protein n=1 Tax=Ophiobolus disseminans TaxID=1469910 RepID=A0A6A6ZNH7_9PLEO|nr:hypothetical protein CC86DRAFT_385398 [Ophiobolus disseminans]
MEQAQFSENRRHGAQDLTARSPGFAGHTPNMLPLSFAATRGSALETSPFTSFLPPNAPGLPIQHPLSAGWSPFSESAFPFLGQLIPASPPATAATGACGTNAGYGRASPKAVLISRKEHGYRDPIHELLPVIAPVSPAQTGQKRSRLPSDDVGRKAPRKSVASSPLQNSVPRLPNGKPVKARGRPRKQKIQQQDSPQQVQHKTPAKNGPGRPRKPTPATIKRTHNLPRQSTPPTVVRSRPVVLDDEDEDNNDQDVSPMNSIETDASNTSIARGTLQIRPRRPHPEHDYPIPEGMESVHRALGEDNWNEYLALVERRWLDTITEEQLVTATRYIFSVFDEPTRRRIQKRVVDMVVLPVLRGYVEIGEELQG